MTIWIGIRKKTCVILKIIGSGIPINIIGILKNVLDFAVLLITVSPISHSMVWYGMVWYGMYDTLRLGGCLTANF